MSYNKKCDVLVCSKCTRTIHMDQSLITCPNDKPYHKSCFCPNAETIPALVCPTELDESQWVFVEQEPNDSQWIFVEQEPDDRKWGFDLVSL